MTPECVVVGMLHPTLDILDDAMLLPISIHHKTVEVDMYNDFSTIGIAKFCMYCKGVLPKEGANITRLVFEFNGLVAAHNVEEGGVECDITITIDPLA